MLTKIAILFLLYMVSSIFAQPTCANQTNCDACSLLDGCGWCAPVQKCLPGNIQGPINSTCLGSAWEFGKCTPCESISDCRACRDHSADCFFGVRMVPVPAEILVFLDVLGLILVLAMYMPVVLSVLRIQPVNGAPLLECVSSNHQIPNVLLVHPIIILLVAHVVWTLIALHADRHLAVNGVVRRHQPCVMKDATHFQQDRAQCGVNKLLLIVFLVCLPMVVLGVLIFNNVLILLIQPAYFLILVLIVHWILFVIPVFRILTACGVTIQPVVRWKAKQVVFAHTCDSYCASMTFCESCNQARGCAWCETSSSCVDVSTSTCLFAHTCTSPTPPTSCGFRAGDFLGGMFLMLVLFLIAFAGLAFYRWRTGSRPAYTELK